MKTPTILCLALLLVAVSGQFPNLSPSFSFEGSLVSRPIYGYIGSKSFYRYNLAVDISRQLQKVEQVDSYENTITISSGIDDANYRSERPYISRTCSDRYLNPSKYFPLDSNVWERFANSVESPSGTFTYERFTDTHTVVIENGVPVSYNIDSSTVTTITFTSYSDEVPAHSVFTLSSECSSLDCNACYNPNPSTNPPNSTGVTNTNFPNLSPSFSFEGSLRRRSASGYVYDSFYRYDLAVDISRRLQKVDQLEGFDNTVTISSGVDDANYRSINNFYAGTSWRCSDRYLNPSRYFPLDSNVWERFANSVESPNGTFTYERFSDTHTVVIENGMPVRYTISSSSGTKTTIKFTSYSDVVPVHSVFTLQSECSSLDCNACYDPNPATNPPTTSTNPPTTSTNPPPTTSTNLPTTSTNPPTTATNLPTTSSNPPPTTSTNLPTTSTNPPTTSTNLPTTSTNPPTTTSTNLPTTSTNPPTTTSTNLPTTSTNPPTTATNLPTTSSNPPTTTSTNLPTTSTNLPTTSTNPPTTSTKTTSFGTNAPNPTGVTSINFPNLSPSFSFRGSLLENFGSLTTRTPRFNLAVDIDRQLQRIEEETVLLGFTSERVVLSSASDNSTYETKGQLFSSRSCEVTSLEANPIFPIDMNVWKYFATATEAPAGTFTYINGLTTYKVVIENRLPVSYSVSFFGVESIFTIDSFSNHTPPHSDFSLPGGCSAYECDACYSGAAAVASSVLLVLSALLVYLMTAV